MKFEDYISPYHVLSFKPTFFVFLLQDSVYYHPTLNPTGAPPPGKPPMFKSSIGNVFCLALNKLNIHNGVGS